jgi:hypothetical protein
MNPVAAMELLPGRRKKARSNAKFLRSMHL